MSPRGETSASVTLAGETTGFRAVNGDFFVSGFDERFFRWWLNMVMVRLREDELVAVLELENRPANQELRQHSDIFDSGAQGDAMTLA